MKMVELDEAGNLPVRSYSLGMRRKLLLARALLHEPRVLYLDEPTANLDIHSAEVVHRILRERVADGATVVLTTHDMVEVEKATRLYQQHGLGARDDAMSMQYLISGWKFDPKRPCMMR